MPWRPLSSTQPREVAEALRQRAAKIDDDTTIAYLLLAAETIDRCAPASTSSKKRQRRGPRV